MGHKSWNLVPLRNEETRQVRDSSVECEAPDLEEVTCVGGERIGGWNWLIREEHPV